MARKAVRRIAVVVPARDEEAVVARCLDGLRLAADRLPDVVVEVVVVANGCADATAAVARELGAHVMVLPDADVGAARCTGAAWAIRDGVEGLWIATTDADSVVPESWLVAQVQVAEAGADVFLGTIALDAVDAQRHGGWVARYAEGVVGTDDHRHVHGASLGVRATAYVAAGGFRPASSHEDVDLVTRLQAAGAVVATVSGVPVMTSARHDPRAREGVGADLAAS